MELSCAIRFIMRPSSDYDSIAERGTGMESVIKRAPRAGWADAGSDERRQSFGELSPHVIDNQLDSTKVSPSRRATLENMATQASVVNVFPMQ